MSRIPRFPKSLSLVLATVLFVNASGFAGWLPYLAVPSAGAEIVATSRDPVTGLTTSVDDKGFVTVTNDAGTEISSTNPASPAFTAPPAGPFQPVYDVRNLPQGGTQVAPDGTRTVVSPDGTVAVYNPNGTLRSLTGPAANGGTSTDPTTGVTTSYNADTGVTTVTTPGGGTTVTGPAPNGGTSTDPNTGVTTSHNSDTGITTVVDPRPGGTSSATGPAPDGGTSTDPNTGVTTSYDPNTGVTTVINPGAGTATGTGPGPDGGTSTDPNTGVTTSYDPNTGVTTRTDRNGNSTTSGPDPETPLGAINNNSTSNLAGGYQAPPGQPFDIASCMVGGESLVTCANKLEAWENTQNATNCAAFQQPAPGILQALWAPAACDTAQPPPSQAGNGGGTPVTTPSTQASNQSNQCIAGDTCGPAPIAMPAPAPPPAPEFVPPPDDDEDDCDGSLGPLNYDNLIAWQFGAGSVAWEIQGYWSDALNCCGMGGGGSSSGSGKTDKSHNGNSKSDNKKNGNNNGGDDDDDEDDKGKNKGDNGPCDKNLSNH